MVSFLVAGSNKLKVKWQSASHTAARLAKYIKFFYVLRWVEDQLLIVTSRCLSVLNMLAGEKSLRASEIASHVRNKRTHHSSAVVAACFLNKAEVFKFSLRRASSSLHFHDVFILESAIHWRWGNAPRYLMQHIYLIGLISDLSLTKPEKWKCVCVFYQSRPAALTTNPHPMLKIIKQNLFPQIQRPRLIPCIWEEKVQHLWLMHRSDLWCRFFVQLLELLADDVTAVYLQKVTVAESRRQATKLSEIPGSWSGFLSVDTQTCQSIICHDDEIPEKVSSLSSIIFLGQWGLNIVDLFTFRFVCTGDYSQSVSIHTHIT